jgi:hypothetical protein
MSEDDLQSQLRVERFAHTNSCRAEVCADGCCNRARLTVSAVSVSWWRKVQVVEKIENLYPYTPVRLLGFPGS